MRTAFIRTLIDLARNDRRIYLLVGDLGYSVVEPFADEFPNRFINVGVAEQNMTGLATGLALCGNVVFTYSIGCGSPFSHSINSQDHCLIERRRIECTCSMGKMMFGKKNSWSCVRIDLGEFIAKHSARKKLLFNPQRY